MGKQMRSSALVALTAVAVLGWPAAAPEAATPVRGGTLEIGFPSDTKTLNPVFSVEFTERQVLYMVYNTLTNLGTDFSIKPELAKSWEVENGGLRYVMHLRDDVNFHDGTHFDAEVVKWNIEIRLDEKVNSPQRKQLEPIVESVEVIDKYTVAINLKQRFPGLLGELAQRVGFMVSPAAWDKLGEDLGSNPVGSGPFVFKEWVRGSHIRLERNPNYWEAGLPYVDAAVFRDISGSVVGIQRLMTGELDFTAPLSPNDAVPIQDNQNVVLHPTTVGRWYSLQWHWDEPPYNDSNLRKAVAHAIDRERIVEISMRGKAPVANGATPPGLWWHDPSIEGYAYDPAKAKELLAQSAYKGEELTLFTPSSNVYQLICQLVQEQLQAVGIKVKLEPVAESEWYSRVVKRAINFTPTRWTQRPDPDGLLFILFHSQGYANTTGYKNPAFDALLDEARSIADVEQRKALYAKAERMLAEDLPNVPLFFAAEYAATRKSVHGFEWIPDQIPRFRGMWKE